MDILARDWVNVRVHRRAVALAPNDHGAQNNLDWLPPEDRTHWDEALRLAQRAVSASSRNGRFMDTLGWVYLQQGRLTEAEQQFGLASDPCPSDVVIQHHLGLVARKQGRTIEAMGALKRPIS